MFINLLKKASLVLLPLNFIACSLFTPAEPSPTAAQIDNEEQAVYSFFVQGQGPALILQDTSTGMTGDDPQAAIDSIKSGLKGVSGQALDNFLERNRQAGRLSPDMDLGVNYVLLTGDELATISSGPDWGDLLTAKYPGAHGYLIFSRVGFNRALDQAVIYVGNVEGPLMGEGNYYLMEKQDGGWLVKDQVMAWIS